jgi:hypothetical protein
VQTAPEAYAQPEPPPPSQPQYWYYCPTSQAYYPYVKELLGRVAPGRAASKSARSGAALTRVDPVPEVFPLPRSLSEKCR